MKWALFFLCIFPTLIFSEIVQLPPMWLGNSEFYDRHQKIDESINFIEKEMKKLPKKIKKKIKHEILIIKYNLGYPIELNDL